MKKLLSIFICILLLIMPLSITVFAADELLISSPADTISVGNETTVTISLADGTVLNADTIEITILHNSQIKLLSGEFIGFTNADSEILLNSRAATLTLSETNEIKGEFFKLIITTEDVGSNIKLKLNITFKSNTTSKRLSATKSFTGVCSEHNFSNWNITTSALCESTGTRQRTCTICDFTESETINALGHDFSDIEILRKPTCTEEGYQRAFCKNCQQKLLEKIAPTGHNMGEWTTITASTCEEKGLEQSKCTGCELTESRETNPLGHEFQEAVITTEPTIGKEGVKTGYCVRCNKSTDSPVPCAYTDKQTGIHFNTSKGVYPESAKVKITEANKGSSLHSGISDALAHITNQFYGYNIEITNLGFAVEPNGEVTVTFPIPENFGASSVFYFITGDNTVKKLTATQNEDATQATIKFMGNGRYAVCKTSYATDEEFISPASSNGILIIVLSMLSLIICWTIVIIKILKVKRPQLYRKIINIFPTKSEVKNAIKRNIFIFKEKIKKPH